jgi:hypothetical protein
LKIALPKRVENSVFSQPLKFVCKKYTVYTYLLIKKYAAKIARPDQTRPDQTRPDQTRPDQTNTSLYL